jgi:hypothetical protein
MHTIAMGNQLPPDMCVAIGSIAAIFGAIGMCRSFKTDANFHWSSKGGGRGVPMSRASHFLFHGYIATFGIRWLPIIFKGP